MRKLKDLKPNEVINPANAAEDKALRELFNQEGFKCGSNVDTFETWIVPWQTYGRDVCYSKCMGVVVYSVKGHEFARNNTILPASLFVNVDNVNMWHKRVDISKENKGFNPQPGDMVSLQKDSADPIDYAYYLGKIGDRHICSDKSPLESDASMWTRVWHIYPIPRKVTVTMAEIAEWKGCREDEIEIKIK